MKKYFLRRLTVMIMLLALTAIAASAQSSLNIDMAFQRFGHAHGCKMVEMNDASLHGFRMHVYKSLTYKNIGDDIEEYLKADRKRAKKIREVVENGQIESGYYMMSPTLEGMNRYILFSNGSGNRGAIIYIEGYLSPDDILKLCYSK
jgi:hypothetical protein